MIWLCFSIHLVNMFIGCKKCYDYVSQYTTWICYGGVNVVLRVCMERNSRFVCIDLCQCVYVMVQIKWRFLQVHVYVCKANVYEFSLHNNSRKFFNCLCFTLVYKTCISIYYDYNLLKLFSYEPLPLTKLFSSTFYNYFSTRLLLSFNKSQLIRSCATWLISLLQHSSKHGVLVMCNCCVCVSDDTS